VINKEKEMHRFTLRSALVLAVVLLLAGATTSFAQVIFSASAGNPQVRIGGMTEAVGDLTLSASANGTVPGTGAVVPGPTQLVITLTYSTTITNKALAGTNLVNFAVGANPAIAIDAATTLGIKVTVANITNLGVAATTIAWQASGNTLTITIANVAAAAGIQFNNNNVACPVGAGCLNTTITVHGVRVNAAGLGIPPSVPMVNTFLNTNPSANMQLAAGSTSLTVGTLSTAISSISRLTGGTTTLDSFYKTAGGKVCSGATPSLPPCVAPAQATVALTIYSVDNFTTCGVKAIPQGASAGGSVVITDAIPPAEPDGKTIFGDGVNNALGIKIVEGYPGALSSKTDENAKSNAAEVDGGTHLRIDFSGLPPQAVLAAPERIDTTLIQNKVAAGLSADLIGNYSGCTIGVGCGAINTEIADVKAASGGAVSFEYEVTANAGTTAGTASSIVIPFFLLRTSTPIDMGTINIAVTLGPRLGSNVVRFSDQQSGNTTSILVKSCTTDLFYPWVTNVGTFDTGIAVINGNQDNGTSRTQSGQCVAYGFDGSTTAKKEVWKSTTPILGPGQTYAFTVSDPTQGKPGFTGYVHVVCPFQAAHGFAMLTWGYGVTPTGQAPPFSVYLALFGKPTGTSGVSAR
jgi:hypothetical protein